jgi:hypothetical protein
MRKIKIQPLKIGQDVKLTLLRSRLAGSQMRQSAPSTKARGALRTIENTTQTEPAVSSFSTQTEPTESPKAGALYVDSLKDRYDIMINNALGILREHGFRWNSAGFLKDPPGQPLIPVVERMTSRMLYNDDKNAQKILHGIERARRDRGLSQISPIETRSTRRQKKSSERVLQSPFDTTLE